jgi:hypothetical protein
VHVNGWHSGSERQGVYPNPVGGHERIADKK